MVLIIFLYFLASIIFTFPLVLKLGSFLPGQPNDAFVYLWNIWNFWHQILSGVNPFFTDSVMYPIGANLFFHTYAPLVSIIALPFLKNLSLFMGLLIISAVTLSSLSAYLLSFKLTGNKTASFIGGLIYGVSPIIHSFIVSQHYYFLFSAIFYPLGVYLLINFFENRRIKYLYSVIVLFWVVLSIDYYSAVLYSLIIVVIFFLNERLNFIKVIKYVFVFILALVVPFVFLYSLDKNFKEFVNFRQQFNTSSSCNTNLLGFITPNINNPIIGRPVEINLDTPSYFLGWGLLTIAVVSLVKNRKYKYISSLSFVFILFLLLSLGTGIKFGQRVLLEGVLTPFYYFLKLPILGSIDCPIRFPIILQLCLSVFITIFVSKHKKINKLVFVLLTLIIIEYGVVNKDFSSTKVPQVYQVLSLENDNRTLLELPSGITESKSAFGYDWSIQALHSQQMYWQTVHAKPRVGIYISRLTPDKYKFFRSEPIVSDIFTYTSAGGTKPERSIAKIDISNFIKKFNLGYIILSPNNRQVEFSNFIERTFTKFIVDKKIIDNFIYYKLSEIQL